MKHLTKLFARSDRPIAKLWPELLVMGGAVLLVGLLWFRLGSLTSGNAADIERATAGAAGDWHTILDNPLNAPYSALVWLSRAAGLHGVTSLRLISTLYGLLAAALFYLVARQWHSLRVALLASWLFVSSAWFLHTARLGSPEILWIVSMLGIVVVLTPNKHGRDSKLALPETIIPLTLVLYVPGMVWLVLTGVMLQRKNLREAWQATTSMLLRLVSVVIGLAVTAPLAYGLARKPALIKSWLGDAPNVSGIIPPLTRIVHNLIDVPKSFLFAGSFDAVHWLGHLPLLSAFEIVMTLLGIYFYGAHLRAARTRLILLLAAIGWLIVGVAGPTAISLLVPVIYLLAAAGVAYLLHFWLRVFPSNPLARSLGIGVIALAIILTSLYQTRSYYVAWRYNPDTRAAFSRPLQ